MPAAKGIIPGMMMRPTSPKASAVIKIKPSATGRKLIKEELNSYLAFLIREDGAAFHSSGKIT